MKRSHWLVLTATGAALALFALGWFGRAAMAQRLDAPRIPPVAEADLSTQQQALLDAIRAPSNRLNVFTTMVNHPKLAEDWLAFGSHILRENSIPAREREILILRIGWLCRAEYEWAQHARIGKAVGLTEEDLARIMEGPGAGGLSDLDQLLLQATDELHQDAFITDATWSALSAHYDTHQMMDLVFTVGQYNLVSMALNSFGVQLEEGASGFPE